MMKRLLLSLPALSFFIQLFHYAVAIPKFNTINGNYYNGTTCPAVTQRNVLCPQLLSQSYPCPKGGFPTGVTFTCPTAPGVTLRACLPSSQQQNVYVNITNYKPANATLQIYEACSLAMNMDTDSIKTWKDLKVNTAMLIWNVCDPPNGMNFPIKATIIIIVLCMYLAFFPCWALWVFYKKRVEKKNIEKYDLKKINHQFISTSNLKKDDYEEAISEKIAQLYKKERQVELMTEKKNGSDMDNSGENETEENIPIQTGYKTSFLGSAVMSYMSLISIFWVIVLLLITLDYYGYVTGTPFGLFYNSYDLSSKAFCLVWFLATSWYLFINVARSKIQNHFRIATPFDQSDYIQIEKKRQVIQLLNNNDSLVQQKMALYENQIRKKCGLDMLVKTVRVQTNGLGHRYFEFQSTRYNFNDRSQSFKPATVNVDMNKRALLAMDNGLKQKVAEDRLETLGPNFIEVIVPSFTQAFWEELTGFFYIYQLMILWCYYYLAYWQIGLSDTLVILLAALIKVFVRLKSEKRVKAMAEHVDKSQVLRDNSWIQVSTADLVPGDLIKVESGQVVPVDAVILNGDIVADESSLTGEPLPIRKFPIRADDDELLFDSQKSGKMNTLFAGTTVKQAKSNSTALVLKTRTNTDKGQLVQRILFPQPVSFIFNEQLKIVFVMLLMWALVMLGFGCWWLGGTGMTAWFYGTICAAQLINPLLPAILVVGQSVAANRLKRKGVFCVDLPRILMAGKVQVFCFDKTGTLTKEGLEYYRMQPVLLETREKPKFDVLYTSSATIDDHSGSSNPQTILLQMGLSSCHSVTTLNDKYIGNPVDIVMFESTSATLGTNEKTGNDMILNHMPGIPNLEIIKRFEFQHARASMSIAVKNVATGHTHVFCKGSFERISEIVSSNTLPVDFDQVTAESAKSGCYVLGMAHCDLGILDQEQENQLRANCTRDQLESNLDFLGLVLFKNQLKEDTAAAITQIKQGDIRVVMITGDNALTGIYIGKQCGLVPENTSIIVGDIADDNTSDYVSWTDTETGKVVTNIEAAIATGSELAVTGKAFRWLVENGKMREYLFSTRIFARMTPIDKMTCVELIMEKAITAMCGDGGNDCGALRSAHVGIAMSETEASVVSPFSTPRRSVQSCVDLLIQGRSALATSFASYKYLIMYGETMACVKFCTFYYTMSFSQWNFILVDAFITVFCSFAVTQAGAAKRLSSHRPTARILGPEVVLSVFGQLFINVWFLIGAFIWLYTKDDFFRCHEWDARATDASKWWLLGDSFEAEILTFITLFQFVNSAMVFNYGYIFRQRWYRNYLLVFIWAVFISIVSFWELADPNQFGCLVRINCGSPDVLESLGYSKPNFYVEPYNNPLGHNVLPRSFRYQLWVYSIVNMITVHIWERFIVLGPVRQWLRQKHPLKRLVIKL